MQNVRSYPDVNIHLDDTTSTHATRFTALLDDFGLHDIVGQPTHRHGHQLDVFVTRRDQSVKSVTVDPPLLSDHSLITATFDAAGLHATAQNAIIWRRRWASFDYDDFINELQESRLVLDPPADVNELVECYDTTLGQVCTSTADENHGSTIGALVRRRMSAY